jgi:hypothetical protein
MIKLIVNKIKSLFFFLKPRKVVAQYKLFFKEDWFECSVDAIAPYVYKILLVVSDVAWGDDPYHPKIKRDDISDLLEKIRLKYPGKVIVFQGSWNQQISHVQAGLDYIKQNIPEATHCLYVDGDEIYSPSLIKTLKKLIIHPKYFQKAIRISYNTYFKTIYYKIDPIKYPTLLVMFPITDWITYRDARNVNASVVDIPHLCFEHPAYVRQTDEQMRLKIEAHRETEPIMGDWYHEVWLRWTPETRNFHPTHPEFWERVVPVNPEQLPRCMVETFEEWKNKHHEN